MHAIIICFYIIIDRNADLVKHCFGNQLIMQ